MSTRSILFRFLPMLLLVGASTQLMAIPAWARLTGTSCSTCHQTPSLQLTSIGLEFQRNGFRSEATKLDAKSQSVSNYTSLTFEGNISGTKGATPSSQTDKPVIGLITGGALSDHFSYLAMYYPNASSDPTANLETAYLQYNASLGKNALLTIRGGQINPIVLRNFGLGVSSIVGAPLVLNTPVNANSPFSFDGGGRGIDANLYLGSFELTTGILDPATGTPQTNPTNRKDTYAAALWRFDDWASGVGVLRYDGQNMVFNTPGDPTTGVAFADKFNHKGFMARFIRDKWRIMGAIYEASHQVDALGTQVKSRGWYSLVDYYINDNIGAFARYEKLSPDRNDNSSYSKMAMLGLNGMLFQTDKSGGRWVLQAHQADQNGQMDKQILLNVVWAF